MSAGRQQWGAVSITDADAKLREAIASRILELCGLWDEVTTSDLQSMVDVVAAEIIIAVRDH